MSSREPIVCSACGKAITKKERRFQEPLHIKHFFGDGSENDMDKVEVYLCMKCADKFLPVLKGFCKFAGDKIVCEYRLVDEEMSKEVAMAIIAGYGEQ
jgi:DNA-directed RNA polymerase subunit RPC12/RpoP